LSVLTAIDFDAEAKWRTIEIKRVWAERMLASKI